MLLKEYLYRISRLSLYVPIPHVDGNGFLAMRVAEEENSNVLRANALHHRSDAFSGLIALAAIVCCFHVIQILF